MSVPLTGTYENGNPFSFEEPTRFDAQMKADDLYVGRLISGVEWSRLTGTLSEPDPEAAP